MLALLADAVVDYCLLDPRLSFWLLQHWDISTRLFDVYLLLYINIATTYSNALVLL